MYHRFSQDKEHSTFSNGVGQNHRPRQQPRQRWHCKRDEEGRKHAEGLAAAQAEAVQRSRGPD